MNTNVKRVRTAGYDVSDFRAFAIDLPVSPLFYAHFVTTGALKRRITEDTTMRNLWYYIMSFLYNDSFSKPESHIG